MAQGKGISAAWRGVVSNVLTETTVEEICKAAGCQKWQVRENTNWVRVNRARKFDGSPGWTRIFRFKADSKDTVRARVDCPPEETHIDRFVIYIKGNIVDGGVIDVPSENLTTREKLQHNKRSVLRFREITEREAEEMKWKDFAEGGFSQLFDEREV